MMMIRDTHMMSLNYDSDYDDDNDDDDDNIVTLSMLPLNLRRVGLPISLVLKHLKTLSNYK